MGDKDSGRAPLPRPVHLLGSASWSKASPLLLLVVLGLSVVFDFINGFHDTANAIATSVSTRALRPDHAILLSATANFAGALTGTAVATTIGAGLVDSTDTNQVVVAAALLGAIFWNLLTWRLGIPSSSSHALIGGLLGATIVAAGTQAVIWEGVFWKVLVPLVALADPRDHDRLPVHGRPAQRVPAAPRRSG